MSYTEQELEGDFKKMMENNRNRFTYGAVEFYGDFASVRSTSNEYDRDTKQILAGRVLTLKSYFPESNYPDKGSYLSRGTAKLQVSGSRPRVNDPFIEIDIGKILNG